MMEQNGFYSEEYGENQYMEQEEEWEREGLLDPAWEKQQKKVSESYIKHWTSINEITHVDDSIQEMEYFVLITCARWKMMRWITIVKCDGKVSELKALHKNDGIFLIINPVPNRKILTEKMLWEADGVIKKKRKT